MMKRNNLYLEKIIKKVLTEQVEEESAVKWYIWDPNQSKSLGAYTMLQMTKNG